MDVFDGEDPGRIAFSICTEVGELRQNSSIVLASEFRARYQLGRMLGCGAMGMVVEGTQPELSRRVAVKFLSRPQEESLMERFLAEGRLLAQIRHPNVTAVYEQGQMDGYPYMVLELLEGGTLRNLMNRRCPLAIREALDLMLGCLSGLEACHSAGIIHRDLKPENILFSADRVPKLADFGLAKEWRGPASVTKTGTVLGTPGYMPPEQLRGELATTAADVYAMGVILYEMFTGDRPFAGPSLVSLMHQQLQGNPSAALGQLKHLPPDLVRYLACVLSPEAAERPQDAGEMRRALLEIQAERPRNAYRPSLRTPRLPSRARTPWGYIPVVVGLLMAILTMVALRTPRRPRPDPVQEADSGRPILRLGASSFFHPGLQTLAFAPDSHHLVTTGHDHAIRIWEATTGHALAAYPDQGARAAIFDPGNAGCWAVGETGMLHLIEGGRVQSRNKAINDSDAIVMRGGVTVVRERNGTLHLLPGPKDRWRARTFPGNRERDMAFALSPTGDRLAWTYHDGVVHLHSTAAERELWSVRVDYHSISSLVFVGTGEKLAAACVSGEIHIRDAATGQAIRSLESAGDWVDSMDCSPDGLHLAAAGRFTLRVFRTDGSDQPSVSRGDGHWYHCVRYSPDGRLLACAARGGRIRIWDTNTGDELPGTRDQESLVENIQLSPDGAMLATVGPCDQVALLRLPGSSAAVLPQRSDPAPRDDPGALRVRPVPATTRLFTQLYLPRHPVYYEELKQYFGDDHALTFSPDSRMYTRLYSDWTVGITSPGSPRENLHLLDLCKIAKDHSRLLTTLSLPERVDLNPRNTQDITGVSAAFCASRDLVAVGIWPGDIYLGPTNGATPPRLLVRGTQGVPVMAFDPDGQSLWSMDRLGQVCRWGLATRALKTSIRFYAPNSWCSSRVVAPEADRVAFVDEAGHCYVGRISENKLAKELALDKDLARSIALAPAKNRVAVGTVAGDIILMDLTTSRRVDVLRGHSTPVRILRFSRNGDRLASLSEAGETLIWNIH